MTIDADENVWAHPLVTEKDASDFFGLPVNYSQGEKDEFLVLNLPGEKGRPIRIRVPKPCIADRGWVQIMPYLKKHIGFFAEDMTTSWVFTEEAKLLPDTAD